MIKIPYINTRAHLSLMMKNFDAFASNYNLDINKKRDEATTIDQKRQFQTIKPTHRALFKDLVLELGKNMLHQINVSERIEREQGNKTGILNILRNPFCGDDFFVCSTNRYLLSKHNTKEYSTIYRNLNRLIEAGVINERIGHGKKSNFELLINSRFLIVSDKANPEYNPILAVNTQNLNETSKGKEFSPSTQFAKCKENKTLQEQLLNEIYSGKPESGQNPSSDFEKLQNVAKTDFENVENPTASVSDRTFTRTEEVQPHETSLSAQLKSVKLSGGPADLQEIKKIRGLKYVCDKKTDPIGWHNYQRLSFSAMFIDYLIEKIYDRRGVFIIPEARIKAIEYAEKHYFTNPKLSAERVNTPFKPCDTLEEYANRLNGLKWCIDAANRYAARNNSYFLMIDRYINVDENGLIKTLDWYRRAKFNESEKARHLKNIKDLRKLNELTRQVVENPDFSTYRVAELFVEHNLNKYIWVFRRSLSTLLTKIHNNHVE